jgi:hypothetical protein
MIHQWITTHWPPNRFNIITRDNHSTELEGGRCWKLYCLWLL